MRFLSAVSSWLGVGGLFIAAVLPAAAQTSPADSPPADKVYTFVEKMPQLPGGGGMAAVLTAIQKGITYPREALLARAQGRGVVRFTIAADGAVQQVAIVHGFRDDCDSAVVRAVRQLPRFEPGLQAGQPVAVSLTAPVTFAMQVVQLPPVRRP